MNVTIIAAVAANMVIGNKGKLPWNIPEDLQYFKEITEGGTVIMGRKTWESLPAHVRPLKGRRNIVLTTSPTYIPFRAEVAHSLGDALTKCGACEKVFIIGGASVFEEAQKVANHMLLTHVQLYPDGDTFFPNVLQDWALENRRKLVTKSGVEITFAKYFRRSGSGAVRTFDDLTNAISGLVGRALVISDKMNGELHLSVYVDELSVDAVSTALYSRVPISVTYRVIPLSAEQASMLSGILIIGDTK